MLFSIIIPVYNRPKEVEELLESLSAQTCKNFEVVLVEDGSTVKCDGVAAAYKDKIEVNYFFKPNSGRSLTRNYGMEHAKGDYFVFFDSDCIIPPCYFETLSRELDAHYTDCYGGPDKAHESFTVLQKAISHSMTSFLTTGGIRGRKKGLEKFTPRTFNMGFSREVYDKVGGFKDMFGEDIDLSLRIREAGFRTELFTDLYVYHKRRVSLKSFHRQVNTFGRARIDLYRQHGDNVFGASGYGVGYFCRKLSLGIGEVRGRLFRLCRQAGAFREQFRGRLSSEELALLADVARLPEAGFLERRRILWRHRIFKSGFLRNLGMFLVV